MFVVKKRPTNREKKLEMENIRLVSFSGKDIETTVTAKASVADAWVRNICSMYSGQKIIVGLDCEWRPNVIPAMNNKIATLQLCVDTKCIILQLFFADSIPQSLKDFLGNPNITFVGVEVLRDVTKLRNEYGLLCANISDVRDETLKRWPFMFYRKPGLKDIANRVVGLHMPKPKHVCQSDWESRVLDDMQIEYACFDAYASFKIGHKLLKDM